jgi:archaemetzincin
VRSALAALVGLGLLGGVAVGQAPLRIDLQPMGSALPDDDVGAVRDALVAFYGADVRLRPRVAPPREAWYPPRRRWRADKILAWLDTRARPEDPQLLALIAEDISTTKGSVADWGVLGLGDIDGKSGIISRFRCDRAGGHPLLARTRLAKVAVHEIGHTLGLQHCPTTGCLMHDAEGKVATADGEYDFCPRCRALLAEHGHVLPADPKPPWPRP